MLVTNFAQESVGPADEAIRRMLLSAVAVMCRANARRPLDIPASSCQMRRRVEWVRNRLTSVALAKSFSDFAKAAFSRSDLFNFFFALSTFR